MKQLIILVAYLNIGSLSKIAATERLLEFKTILNETFDEKLQSETNTIIRMIVIPVKDQHSYVECIFPCVPDLPEEFIERMNQIEFPK